jgi:hypothetical protein
MSKQEKTSYKQENGTSKVGDALRWLGKQGKTFAPEILALAANVTGIQSLNKLGDTIRGDETISAPDKALLIEELELDMVREEEISKRWIADAESDSWMSKNIRPMTLAFLLACMFTFIMLDSFTNGFEIKESFVGLLETLLVTAISGYFVMREVGKGISNWKDKK